MSVRFLRLAGQLDRPAPGRRDGASCRAKHNPGRVRDAEKTACTLWFETLSRGDVALVGGKNSSLGEMVQQLGRKGIKVPGGFATTADAYRAYLAANALNDRIARTLQHWQDHKISLHEAGSQVRAMILEGNWPKDIEADILAAYRELSRRAGTTDLPVAVRSSATAEDLAFVINNTLKVHPMALVHFDSLKDEAAKARIADLTRAFPDKTEYFIDGLARGLSQIAAVAYPNPVIVRMSDFKTNEYADLLGGREFEPHEENPMIGFRGASRYYSPRYEAGFALECKAIQRLRKDLGFDNVIVMIPFCRSPAEADRVLATMAKHGLKRGKDGLQVYVMGEIPANVILAEDFARRFDGFSIGSNDLTQLTLGVDRDAEDLAALFDESDPAVLWMIESLIARAHKAQAKVGLCGQAPSNDPAFARLLVQAGIDSISVTPDSFIAVKRNVAAAEAPGPSSRGRA